MDVDPDVSCKAIWYWCSVWACFLDAATPFKWPSTLAFSSGHKIKYWVVPQNRLLKLIFTLLHLKYRFTCFIWRYKTILLEHTRFKHTQLKEGRKLLNFLSVLLWFVCWAKWALRKTNILCCKVVPLYHNLLLVTLNFGWVFWLWVFCYWFCCGSVWFFFHLHWFQTQSSFSDST